MFASTASDICRAVLVSKSDDRIVLSLPGTSYRIHLKPASRIATTEGKRITGRIVGRALRLYPAKAGGRFIEPIDGEPRIVQGTILAVDAGANRVLVEMVVPAWLSLDEGQAQTFAVGQMVNMYVESGMSFTPA
jgi:hypothetical protein